MTKGERLMYYMHEGEPDAIREWAVRTEELDSDRAYALCAVAYAMQHSDRGYAYGMAQGVINSFSEWAESEYVLIEETTEE